MKIAFIGFGEAAKAFADSLTANDPVLVFACYDILFDDEGMEGPTAERARASGVAPAESPTETIADADWIVSAVTASSSLDAARSVAPHVNQGQVFFDINSVSPGRKRESAKLFAPKDVTYVDMAVMAPVHPNGHRTPVLVAGSIAGDIADRLTKLDFQFEVVDEAPGAATAIKMVRSLFVKGLEAITVEALLAAEASGCRERIMKSLSGSFAGLGWPEFADYEFERTLKHGRRRAAEMRECAVTLDELGLFGALAGAIADVQERMGEAGLSAPWSGALDGTLPPLLSERRTSRK